ncbi:hypothetical protein SprV_0100515600 [Sparganum proliferum]
MDENERKARDFLEKAQKKSRGGFLSSIFSGRSDSLEEQISLYERAANCFKMAHKWSEAGDAFCQAAKLSSSNKSAHDAANNYVNASVAYRKTDPKTAIDCLNKATEIYIEGGRFSIAARHHMTMAEIYEQDLGDVEQACKQYEQAADYYKGEESNSSAMKCLLKVAHFAASAGKYDKAAKIFEEVGRRTQLHHMTMAEIYEQDLGDVEQACKQYEQAADYYKGEESNSSAMKCLLKVAHFAASAGKYDKAAKIFEEAGKSSMDNKLLRYGAKEHLTKSVICNLLIDTINGQKALQAYEEAYPLFADSRECTLLKKISEALNQESVEGFTAAVAEYDNITRLEPWTTEMLLKLKKTIADEEDIT